MDWNGLIGLMNLKCNNQPAANYLLQQQVQAQPNNQPNNSNQRSKKNKE